MFCRLFSDDTLPQTYVSVISLSLFLKIKISLHSRDLLWLGSAKVRNSQRGVVVVASGSGRLWRWLYREISNHTVSLLAWIDGFIVSTVWGTVDLVPSDLLVWGCRYQPYGRKSLPCTAISGGSHGGCARCCCHRLQNRDQQLVGMVADKVAPPAFADIRWLSFITNFNPLAFSCGCLLHVVRLVMDGDSGFSRKESVIGKRLWQDVGNGKPQVACGGGEGDDAVEIQMATTEVVLNLSYHLHCSTGCREERGNLHSDVDQAAPVAVNREGICISTMLFRYLKEDKPHGSAGGLYYFRDILMEDNPSHIFLLNCDVCCGFPLPEMLDAHRRYGGMGTLLVIKVLAESASEFGELVADPVTKKLLHYTEKPETFVRIIFVESRNSLCGSLM
ncbi:hypothetical protein M8C21_025694 [Ambrosia artemisiifolia]|uniref:Nucleotidyl transferase domain-containing protein n=1 Tax=Ambrosia artemisiifolia TaxID=4212 RepID=A0AAD5G8Z2_AMBAR|nr:hypothetical protein M8C21_025694 [Ambrosia artemisiifolia]